MNLPLCITGVVVTALLPSLTETTTKLLNTPTLTGLYNISFIKAVIIHDIGGQILSYNLVVCFQ
jgi:hypothetical protein